MTKKSSTSNDATAQLAELDAAAKAARVAEDEARREQQARQRRVTEARGELTRAAATGEGIEDAEQALQAAQEAAGDQALPARIEGLAQATRRAEQAAQAFVEPHLAELLEGLRPHAEQVVAAVISRAEELARALDEWNYAAAEVSRIGGRVQWFRQGAHRTPSADRFNALRRALRDLDVPLPLPVGPIENPTQEQERLEREHQEEIDRRRAMRTARSSGEWFSNPLLPEDAA